MAFACTCSTCSLNLSFRSREVQSDPLFDEDFFAHRVLRQDQPEIGIEQPWRLRWRLRNAWPRDGLDFASEKVELAGTWVRLQQRTCGRDPSPAPLREWGTARLLSSGATASRHRGRHRQASDVQLQTERRGGDV